MTGIQIRDTPSYPNDPGTGIRITPGPQHVEIGFTWDGDERWTCKLDPEVLADIAAEAIDWPIEPRTTPSRPANYDALRS